MKIWIASVLLIAALKSFGQVGAQPIEVKRSFGTTFRQNGQNLSPKQLLFITRSNAQAFEEMKIATRNYNAGMIFGLPGGFLIGWPLGTAAAGGKPNWVLAGIGAGLTVVSMTFSGAYSKHARNAVNLYNNGLKKVGRSRSEIEVGLMCNGIGAKIRF